MEEPIRQEIVRRYGAGDSIRKLGRRFDVSRRQIRTVLEEAERLDPLESSPSTPKGSKLDPFREVIREKAEGGLTAVRILREIQELGYDGGKSILGMYLRELRGDRPRKKPFRRFETAPGEESQADWSPYRVPIDGREVVVHAFALILCHSRKAHVRFYRNEREETLLYALTTAFEDFGGMTRRVVFDRMKTVVLGTCGTKTLWNERFADFAAHYGFEPYLCRPRDPDRKGKVESVFPYLEADFLRNASFESFADLNARVAHWLRSIANVRRHGTTQKIPDEEWETEKPYLIRLPELPFGSYRQEIRRVHIDGTISFDGCRYSVPHHIRHREVTVRATPSKLEILDPLGQVVATHPISESRGLLIMDPTHMRPAGVRPNDPLKTDLLVRYPSAASFLEELYTHHKSWTHRHLGKLRELGQRYGEPEIVAAIAKAESARAFSAYAVARILEREVPFCPAPPAPLTPQARQTLCAIEEDDDWGSLEQYRDLGEGQDDAA